ncbi:hypothetical protein [Marinicrinis lubricantis]|uniref:Uncharacterized protein n=1 Tax=Marinicrinis lubricantis TaxID=2086470 RepID=A0ABW1INM3_9BACL
MKLRITNLWNRWTFAGVMIFLLAVLTSPFWLWRIAPAHEMNVIIVDKTIQDLSYREHLGLLWVLNQQKIVKPEGGYYSLEEDYYGFHPEEGESKELPSTLPKADLIYLADTYGVSLEEPRNENDAQTSRQTGLTVSEAEAIRQGLIFHGGTLIAEYNTLAYPTTEEARLNLQDLLQLRASGWMGKYWQSLDRANVPVWAVQMMEENGTSWKYTGEGILLVHEEDEQIVVLDRDDLVEPRVKFHWTADGEEAMGLNDDVRYDDWFEIVEAEPSSDIWAEYQMETTASGLTKLEQAGIPSRIPAVIHHQNSRYDSYYFAGDYADQPSVPSMYQTAIIDKWKQWTAREVPGERDAFYWKVYVPMMKNILANVRNHPAPAPLQSLETIEEQGSTLHARTGSDYIQIYQDGHWKDLLVKGVNMGIAKPGHFPGETAITKQEYLRWFRQIGEMHANAVRVYTIHPPGFYEALLEYNQTAKEPLYLLHGVWVNEEELVASGDAFTPEIQDEFKQEIVRIIDVVHGRASLPDRPGHASGVYTADVSPYLLAWVIGIEWDPDLVVSTNEHHTGLSDYEGRYFRTENAQPFEIWLAEMMDFTAQVEQDTYHWQRPMSFTNWVTTDLLEHPSEPQEKEDMVSVDPNVIVPQESWHAGYFASYHVYPYYPDFFNYGQSLLKYVDHRGEANSYAGYLHELKEAHTMPVLIAEFGVPSSRGLTHRQVYGWNQGFHSEKEQGEIDAGLFEDILHEKMAGGLVFTWQDEWFKRTWNTMDYDNPDRRPFWSNAQTNEQQFGLLSFDPGDKGTRIVVDGDDTEWESAGEQNEEIEREAAVLPQVSNSRNVEELLITSDERYVYFKLRLSGSEPVDWSLTNVAILADTIPVQGQQGIPDVKGLNSSRGIDFVIQLEGPEHSRMLVDSYYDTFQFHYGHMLDMIPAPAYMSTPNNGVYHPIRLALNREITYTDKQGDVQTIPFDAYETGLLQYGNADPQADDFNSLTDVAVSEKEPVIELRIPWMLFGVKDPSTQEIIGDLWKQGLEEGIQVEGFYFTALSYDTASADDQVSKGGVWDRYESADGESQEMKMVTEQMWVPFTWDEWEQPTYSERLKASYYMVQSLFEKANLESVHE